MGAGPPRPSLRLLEDEADRREVGAVIPEQQVRRRQERVRVRAVERAGERPVREGLVDVLDQGQPDRLDHVHPLRPGQRELLGRADLHERRGRQRQRRLCLGQLHDDPGGHVPLDRQLRRRRQQRRHEQQLSFEH